jgi:hypothetical protein
MSLPNQSQEFSNEKEDSHESSSVGAYKGKDSFYSYSKPLYVFN